MSAEMTAPPENADSTGPARPSVLSLVIVDRNALYAAYMPFLKGGGLFIPSNKPYKLGDEVFMLLTFMDSKERVPISGRVAWVTPENAIGTHTPGIGIQFSAQDAGMVRARIETLLLGEQSLSDRPTHTM